MFHSFYYYISRTELKHYFGRSTGRVRALDSRERRRYSAAGAIYMAISVYIYIYPFIYIYPSIHLYLSIHLSIYLSLPLSLFIYVYIYTHIYTHAYTYTYTYIYSTHSTTTYPPLNASTLFWEIDRACLRLGFGESTRCTCPCFIFVDLFC